MAMVTSSTANPHSVKPVEIAAGACQWLKCRTAAGAERYGVPSQSVPGLYYLADTRSCTCPDFQRHGGPCKHIGAVRLHVARVRAEQAREGVVTAA